MSLPPVPIQLPNGELAQIEADPLPERFDTQLQSWDMAFKATDTSDYVVGQVQASTGAQRFILDQVRGRLDMPQTVAAVRALSNKWPNAIRKLVEDKANGPAVVQSLSKEITGLIEVNPEGGKESRAHAVSPELEAGNWFLPHPLVAEWVPSFIEECASFPNGAHDDQVDSWSQGALHMQANNASREIWMKIGLDAINEGPLCW